MTIVKSNKVASVGNSAGMAATVLKIKVNGKTVETQAVFLEQLLIERGLGEARVATALNGDFVPAGRRRCTKLKPGDEIEIVAPRQGG